MTRFLYAQPVAPTGRPGSHAGYRPAHDFYPTPPEAVRALLSVEPFTGSVWECACGDGAIARELSEAGYDVVATDLVDRGYGEGGVDFLAAPASRAVNIITNPPYCDGLADRFAEHALRLTAETDGSVALLLNIASLCHPSRHRWWLDHPPAAIYALDHLVCWPDGKPERAGPRTTTHRYCWMVWRPEHRGRSTLSWLSPAAFRDRSNIYSTRFN